MVTRITRNVTRPDPIVIYVNGVETPSYEGEMLLTTLLAAGSLVLSRDESGRPRSPFCNMGTCFDCIVAIDGPSNAGECSLRRARACLTPVIPGMRVSVPPK